MKSNLWNLWYIEETLSQKLLRLVDKEKISHIDYLKCKLGLETFIINMCKVIVIYASASILNIFSSVFIFHISFLILRTSSYGYHAKTSLGCILSSLVIFILSPFIIRNYIILAPITLFMISVFNFIVLSLFAPKKTKKNYIGDQKQQNKLKKQALISCLFMSIIAFLVPSLVVKNLIILGDFIAVCLVLPIKKENIK